jgi:hypothetical protein
MVVQNNFLFRNATNNNENEAWSKKIGKHEICDGLYNCLLCAIKIKNISKFITYPKGCFL